jgi:hypothetical protein
VQGAGGDVDHRVPVGRSRLEQNDLCPVFAQAVGDDAARRSGADDRIVRVKVRHQTLLLRRVALEEGRDALDRGLQMVGALPLA